MFDNINYLFIFYLLSLEKKRKPQLQSFFYSKLKKRKNFKLNLNFKI